MNVFSKMWCRTFQSVFRMVIPFMPWRKPEVLQLEDGVLGLPKYIKDMGIESVLLITDGGISSLGLCNPLIEALDAEGIICGVYDRTVPNPTINNVEDACDMFAACNARAIIAFGGGSPMDCAKAVGARLARPNKPVHKMKGILKVRRKLPPLFAIPTTAGTGSETTLAAVISNPETHEKYPINDFVLIPRYAVLDPKLTVGLPKKVTSTTGMDALCHAVEAYIGNSNTKETKSKAINATALIFKYLKRAYDDGSDMEARSNMQIAAFDAGVAFTRAYVGNVHAMAHTLGGQYGVPHGLANAVLLPYLLEFYGEKVYAKLARLADAAGIEGADNKEKALAFIQAIKDMNAYMNIPDNFGGIIKEEDLPIMCKHAYDEANPLYPVPVLMGKDDFAAMYRKVNGVKTEA